MDVQDLERVQDKRLIEISLARALFGKRLPFGAVSDGISGDGIPSLAGA